MNRSRVTNLLFSALLLSACTAEQARCEQLPKPGQVIKYFNPVHPKSYLNESQDRLIKKKSFKHTNLSGAQAVENKELGLFASIDRRSVSDATRIDAILNRNDVNGLSCLFAWKDLEPSEENYDFRLLDDLLKACEKHHKSLILRVSTCGLDESADGNSGASDASSDTPEWVFQAGSKSITYTGKDGKPHLMPIFWDTTYLAKWANFINELGKRYDSRTALHSVGITGGGTLGSTSIVPDFNDNKDNYQTLEQKLKSEFNMSPRQLVSHWKYVADLFPKAFPTTRLNFDIDPPTPNRAGQDTLDEIVDYLLYRYGERVYLTRLNVSDGKHGFDQYRVIIKFRADTLTGYQLTSAVTDDGLSRIVKFCLDDGASFAEIPARFFEEKDEVRTNLLAQLRAHLGYQLIAQEADLPSESKSGAAIKAVFKFINVGASTPKRPLREFDKDIPSSYKVQLEMRDEKGRPVARCRHTPVLPTTQWTGGKEIEWQQELKMPALKPGNYSVWLSLMDDATKRKLTLLNAMVPEKPVPQSDLPVGQVTITP
jgi:hypothetical protein